MRPRRARAGGEGDEYLRYGPRLRSDKNRAGPRSHKYLRGLAGQFGSTSDQVKGGKLFGDFMQYGYDTAPVTGASLHYAEGKAVNPNVPAAVVKQLKAQ
jgi:hypothetical protein